MNFFQKWLKKIKTDFIALEKVCPSVKETEMDIFHRLTDNGKYA
jgi:hypothetical protein